MDAAVAAARFALTWPAWADLTPEDRATLLERFVDELEKTSDERARMTSSQNGTPISVAMATEGPGPAKTLRYYAALARTTASEEPRTAGTARVRRSCDASP